MDLVAELADEADPHDPARCAGDERLAHTEIRECSVGQVEIGMLTQHQPRQRSGEVERRVVTRQIDQADRQAPPGRQPPELAEKRRPNCRWWS